MGTNTMKAGIMEATRLTREGRLAEATALIQRTLAGAQAPPGASEETIVAPEPIEATFRVVSSVDASAEAPASAPSGAGKVSPVVADRIARAAAKVRRSPAGRPRVPKFSMPTGGSVLPTMPPGGPGRSQRPVGASVLAGGRWLAGTHTGPAGTRAYKLYLPSGYRGQPVPLVVMLHGCTQNPDDFAAGTGMNVQAEAGGFLVVYPEQASSANVSMCWNWFQAGDQSRDRGEPSLIAGITRQVMAEYSVDPRRVYVAGLSAGGAMAAIMAATYPDLYAAVGVHSGLAPGSASDLPSAFQAMRQAGRSEPSALDHAIPLIVFHGNSDSTVHSSNADQLIRQWAGAGLKSSGGSGPEVHQGQSAGGRSYTREIYPDARGQAFVENWTIQGGAHAWSGGSRDGSYTDPNGPDATREMVRFFLEHPRGTPAVPPAGSRESNP